MSDAREVIREALVELGPGQSDAYYDNGVKYVQAALQAAGFKVLSREPTEEMLNGMRPGSHYLDDIWRAMFDAAAISSIRKGKGKGKG